MTEPTSNPVAEGQQVEADHDQAVPTDQPPGGEALGDTDVPAETRVEDEMRVEDEADARGGE